jgi:hypothetical protein
MSKTVRYFTKKHLIKANNIAIKRGYNRYLSKDFLDGLPDEFKYPLSFHFTHEHKAGKPCERHIRTGFVYDADGNKGVIDCDWNLFYSLPTVEQLLPHEMEEQQLETQTPPPRKLSGDAASL